MKKYQIKEVQPVEYYCTKKSIVQDGADRTPRCRSTTIPEQATIEAKIVPCERHVNDGVNQHHEHRREERHLLLTIVVHRPVVELDPGPGQLVLRYELRSVAEGDGRQETLKAVTG